MITTSRYCSKETIALAKKMANEDNEKYISRAKKSFEKLVFLARILGESEVKIIEEKDSKPKKIVTIIVDAFGNWKWGEEVRIQETL